MHPFPEFALATKLHRETANAGGIAVKDVMKQVDEKLQKIDDATFADNRSS